MYKKLLLITTLSFVVLFSGLFHENVGAAAGVSGEVNTKENNNSGNWHQYESFFQNCKLVWKNGELTFDNKETNNDVNEQIIPKEESNNQEIEENNEEPQVNENNKEVENNDNTLNQFERDVVNLTNVEREKLGLNPLQIDAELSKVAREKSRDMAVNNYFDHNSPTYGSPFDMMRSFGVSYKTAGENIAKGQGSPEEVVRAWMNSPGHRENIVNSQYTHIGVGFVEQGKVWTQQFIGK